MTRLVRYLLSLWLLALACLARPTNAICPSGYDLRTGIRPSGSFECWPNPSGPLEWDGTWQRPERSVQPEGVIESRIYCTSGQHAIVVNDRAVACQPGGWP